MIPHTTRKRVEAVIDKSVETAIDNVSEERIGEAKPIVCINAMGILKTDNCRLSGGKQMCEAYGLTELFSESSLTGKLEDETNKQLSDRLGGIYKEQLKQLESMLEADVDESKKTEYKTLLSGLPTDTSSLNRILSKVTQTISHQTVSRMTTNCNNILYGENLRLITNSSCELGSSWLTFSDQISSVKSLSRCALNLDGPIDLLGDDYTKGVEFIDAYQNFASSWAPKGIEPEMSFYLMYFSLVLIAIVSLPVLVVDDKGNGNIRIAKVVSLVVALILVVASINIWPGYHAIETGMWPYSYPYSRKLISKARGPLCPENAKSVNKVAVTPFGRMTKGQNARYTLSGYNGCGILSKKCDDDQAAIDMEAWENIQEACYNAPIGITKSCDKSSVFTSAITMSDNIPGCKICSGKIGLYDDGVNCSTAKDVNPYVYAGFGYHNGLDNRRKEVTCPENDTDCIGNQRIYSTVSPGECTDQNYQHQKRKAIKMLRACDKVTSFSRTDTKVISEMCPPKVSDYLSKCEDNGKCNYTSKNPNNDAYCKNDLSSCDDTQYIIDNGFDKALRVTCETREEIHKANQSRFVYLIAPIMTFLFLILFSCYALVSTYFKKVLFLPSWAYIVIMLLTIPMVLSIGSSYGVMSAYLGTGEYKDGVVPENGEPSLKENHDFYFKLAIMMSAGLVLLIVVTTATALAKPNI